MAFLLSEQLGRVHRRPFTWTTDDSILYALGIGLVDDPLDPWQLQYVQRPCPVTFPTFAAALARNAAPNVGDLGGDYAGTVLMAQRIELHRALPAHGSGTAESRIMAVRDRGSDQGAVIALETRLLDDQGEALAQITASLLARHDGGCGSTRASVPALEPVPKSAPVLSARVMTRPDQAVLYSLSGDINPLHLDPGTAQARGFARPILHGLCTYALAAKAIAKACAGNDPRRLAALEARFVAPMFPGETLRVDMWPAGPSMAFEAYAAERDVRVLADGSARLRP